MRYPVKHAPAFSSCRLLSWILQATCVLVLLDASPLVGQNWPQFRGPTGDGHVAGKKLVTSWSESENIRWKLAVPGSGWSSPVIWGDQVWVTSARKEGRELYAQCVTRTGELIHDVKIFEVELPEVKNALNSFASPTASIEEGRLYVHFGTYGTACLDTASGEILWSRRDLTLDHQEGPGSSPILHGNYLIFHCDGRDIQYLTALHKQTGKTAWKTNRSIDLSVVGDFARKAFSTPLIVTHAGVTQLVSPAAQGCYSYDPATGKELWRVRYSGFSAVPSPVLAGGKVHVITDFGKPEIWAVGLDGRGDVTETHVDWTFSGSVSSTPSAVAADGLLYFIADKTGVASCLDLESGKLVWQHRIGGSFSASPILSGERVYFFDRDGRTTVLAHGRTPKQLSVNKLQAGCMASPAASDGALYLRSTTHLYRIEAKGR
ncbi:MAG: PQQ-binding-like beta-propeller repeat protein [Pirellulaceae bacterium]